MQLIPVPTSTTRLELKEFKVGNVVVRTWKRSDNNWGTAPWLFAIQVDGEDEVGFSGVPNYCESRRVAAIRGWHRARWKNNGTWDKHYLPSPSTPLPGTYIVAKT